MWCLIHLSLTKDLMYHSKIHSIVFFLWNKCLKLISRQQHYFLHLTLNRLERCFWTMIKTYWSNYIFINVQRSICLIYKFIHFVMHSTLIIKYHSIYVARFFFPRNLCSHGLIWWLFLIRFFSFHIIRYPTPVSNVLNQYTFYEI